MDHDDELDAGRNSVRGRLRLGLCRLGLGHAQGPARAAPFWARFVAPPRCRLRFEFLDAHGRPRHGQTHWLPEDIGCYWNQGDSILVLCDPEQPERPEADVFQIRPDDKERLMTDSRP